MFFVLSGISMVKQEAWLFLEANANCKLVAWVGDLLYSLSWVTNMFEIKWGFYLFVDNFVNSLVWLRSSIIFFWNKISQGKSYFSKFQRRGDFLFFLTGRFAEKSSLLWIPSLCEEGIGIYNWNMQGLSLLYKDIIIVLIWFKISILYGFLYHSWGFT